MITDVDGVRVGHWTDTAAATGCTVVLLPDGTVASGEVRGGAPGTREFELLAPGRLVERVDAVVLAGGSAYGLAACDGVMRWCEEQGRGFPTTAGVVPIVVGMVLYDLGVGDARVRPGAAEGYTAAAGAAGGAFAVGRVGAGTGATFAKWRGREHARPGGLGTATERSGPVVVAAVVGVNAVGDLASPDRSERWDAAMASAADVRAPFGAVAENTTIGLVVTNARLDKQGCHLVAQSAHDGLARALEPVHALGDGDAFVAAATGAVDAHLEPVRLLAARAVERAVVAAVSG